MNRSHNIIEAIEFIDWLLSDPKARLLARPSEWSVPRQLIVNKQLTASQISDKCFVDTALRDINDLLVRGGLGRLEGG